MCVLQTFSMKKTILILSAIFTALGILQSLNSNTQYANFSAPPYLNETNVLGLDNHIIDEYYNWKRSNGPIRIGLQAGHWKTDEMPKEQKRIKENGRGTTGQGIAEWEVVLVIAEKTKEILEKEGYVVDILPATIPENYWADAFVSIHADGNINPMVRGYKVAENQRDRTSNARQLSGFISQKYGEITGFSKDPNITRNMTRYYAFNSRRYNHAVHAMTPSVIIETGFVTNYSEASVLINNPRIPARGIADGVILFIEYLGIDKE